MKKKIAIVLSVLLLIGTLTGCGGGSATSAANGTQENINDTQTTPVVRYQDD